MSKPLFYILAIEILLLSAMRVSAAPETVRLSNSAWAVDIATQSLAVNAYPVGSKTAIPISSGQPGFDNVAEFSQEGNTVSWRIADRFLTVRFQLIEESLSVEFVHDKETNDTLRLTWPVIEDSESLRAYILPLFEGSYVPKDDLKWQEFLSKRGPNKHNSGALNAVLGTGSH